MRSGNLALPLALGLVLGAAATVDAQRVLWIAPRGDAALPERPTAAPLSTEFADDFEAWGDVALLTFDGRGCSTCGSMEVAAAEVRFWSWRSLDAPGRLEAEFTLNAGDLHLKIDPNQPSKIGVRLATPFAARGRHFVSIRLEFVGTGGWSWWRAAGAPRLSPAYERIGPDVWAPAIAGAIATDLAFELATAPWDDLDLARGCGQLEVEVPDQGIENVDWRMLDVAAVDADRAWAIGTAKSFGGERPLVFERRGERWRRLAPPLVAGARLAAVGAVSEKEIWFVGSAPYAPGPVAETRQPLALRYFPGDERWETLPAPLFPAGDSELAGLAARAPADIWLVGWATSPVAVGSERVALLLRWTGSRFEELPIAGEPLPTGERLSAIAADGEEIWAVGGGAADLLAQAPLVVRWTGTEAERITVPGLDRAEQVAAVAVRGREVWIGGRSVAGDPILVNFDGSAWSSHPSSVGGSALAANDKGFVTGGRGLASFIDGKWRAEPGGDLTLSGLAAPRACALFAAGRFDSSLGERGALYRLAPRGFADGFESGGVGAWSSANGAD